VCSSDLNIEIRPILAPVSLTQALAVLHAELESVPPIFIPIPLALDYAAEQHEGRAKTYEAEALFRSFFRILGPVAASRISPQGVAPN
jgi:hypothetical protein